MPKKFKGKISATGFSPCDKRVTHCFNGKMSGRLIQVTIRVFFEGEQFAKSKTTMKKS